MNDTSFVSSAVGRHIRISAQKARLVADAIRERYVGEALTILHFSEKKKASQIIEKVLRSAVANAQQKVPNIDVDTLVVGKIYIDEGPQMKRVRPAPQGRAYRILKRSSHVHIYLKEEKGS